MCTKNLPMWTRVIPARFPHSDSHETENAMRIYKQSQESTHVSTFLQQDLCGRLSVPQNPYGCRLVHVVLENSEGLKENLTEKLTSQGFTLSFSAIDTVMRKAIDEKKGIFVLPDEAFFLFVSTMEHAKSHDDRSHWSSRRIQRNSQHTNGSKSSMD